MLVFFWFFWGVQNKSTLLLAIYRLKVIATKIIKAAYIIRVKHCLPFASTCVHHRLLVRIADLLSFLYCVVFFICLCHVSCEANVASVSWLSILERTFGFLWCLLWILFIRYLMKLNWLLYEPFLGSCKGSHGSKPSVRTQVTNKGNLSMLNVG